MRATLYQRVRVRAVLWTRQRKFPRRSLGTGARGGRSRIERKCWLLWAWARGLRCGEGLKWCGAYGSLPGRRTGLESARKENCGDACGKVKGARLLCAVRLRDEAWGGSSCSLLFSRVPQRMDMKYQGRGRRHLIRLACGRSGSEACRSRRRVSMQCLL